MMHTKTPVFVIARGGGFCEGVESLALWTKSPYLRDAVFWEGAWQHDLSSGSDALGYIAHCYPEHMPGDVRDPQYALFGPYERPDPALLPKGEALLRGWIALTKEPKDFRKILEEAKAASGPTEDEDWEDGSDGYGE